jgi:hypothetical protein
MKTKNKFLLAIAVLLSLALFTQAAAKLEGRQHDFKEYDDGTVSAAFLDNRSGGRRT